MDYDVRGHSVVNRTTRNIAYCRYIDLDMEKPDGSGPIERVFCLRGSCDPVHGMAILLHESVFDIKTISLRSTKILS